MHVITKKRLKDFWEVHKDAEAPLRSWLVLMKNATFDTPHDVKETFPKVDIVGNGRAVFNIGGNKHRLIADVRYEWGRVYVVRVMTHEEYDRIDVRRL